MTNIFNPWQKTLIGILLSFLAIFGFFGNLIVCLTFSRSQHLQQISGNSLIANLAVADMLQCINMVFIITASNDITWYKSNTWCQLNAFSNKCFIGGSLLSLTLISVNRYFVLVKKLNRNIFSKRNNVLFILFVWLYSSFFATAPLLGWSKYIFRESNLLCTHDNRHHKSFNAAASVGLIIIPYATLCFCTWKILKKLRKTRQRVEDLLTTQQNEERRVTVMLMVVIIAFFVIYAPVWTVNIMQMFNFKIAPMVDISTIMIIQLNHICNPLIYGLMNAKFRKAASELSCWDRALVWNNPETHCDREEQTQEIQAVAKF